MTMVASLGIINAFNTLLWEAIRQELENHRVPAYFRAVVGDYICDR